MKPCTECKKYATCTELCEKAENYVSQDHVSQREPTFAECGINNNTPHSWEELVAYLNENKIDFPFLTKSENKILHLFYCDGLTCRKIAKAVSGNRSKTKINQNAVRVRLQRLRAKICAFYSNR